MILHTSHHKQLIMHWYTFLHNSLTCIIIVFRSEYFHGNAVCFYDLRNKDNSGFSQQCKDFRINNHAVTRILKAEGWCTASVLISTCAHSCNWSTKCRSVWSQWTPANFFCILGPSMGSRGPAQVRAWTTQYFSSKSIIFCKDQSFNSVTRQRQTANENL